MDLKKLTPGEIVTAASGVALLIFSFFHWYSVDLGPFGTYSRNGWQSPGAFWSILAILLGIVLAAHVIVEKLSGVDLPDRLGSIGWGVVHLAGGALAFLFLIIKLINHTGDERDRALPRPHRRGRAPRRRLHDGERGRRATPAARRQGWRSDPPACGVAAHTVSSTPASSS